MTNERRAPSGNNGEFKQLYRRECSPMHFTSSNMTYDDYIHSDVWKRLKELRMKKDGLRCQKCGTGMNLIVHHIRYPDVWGMEDVDNDLITLCDRCHAEVHQKDNANKESMK